ncbi:hypothetical protein RF11_13258 [Thelohanellus kitauei]|uniref:Kelch domain-containing protein 10 n=1 Tax=Thelohanellus kitauei TaxID=669202 RepID=A0A0C2MZ00_THEKT|nr:hypothetical protein RF11_13258 [Thelohanellus kitauei]
MTFFKEKHHPVNEEHLCGYFMEIFELFFSSDIHDNIFIMYNARFHKSHSGPDRNEREWRQGDSLTTISLFLIILSSYNIPEMNQRNGEKMPANRLNHCMTSVKEFLIIYGGCESNTRTICNDLLSYNTIGGIWKRHQPPIEIKDTSLSSSICSVGYLVYIFGGDCFDDYTYRQTNSIVSFDIITSTWDIVYSHADDYGPYSPPPMSENYLFYHDGSLYVFGGYHRGSYLDTIYKFCLKSSVWSLLPQHGRFKEVFIFDLCTNTWISRETSSKNQQYPDDRQYVSWAFSGNVGFMSGGIRPFNTYWTSGDIWRIDLESLEWLKLEHVGHVYDHRMSVVEDNYLYSFGGYHDEGSSDAFECFTVQPPRLYRLCLECIRNSADLKKYTICLPAAIVDEFNFNDNDSSLYH